MEQMTLVMNMICAWLKLYSEGTYRTNYARDDVSYGYSRPSLREVSQAGTHARTISEQLALQGELNEEESKGS